MTDEITREIDDRMIERVRTESLDVQRAIDGFVECRISDWDKFARISRGIGDPELRAWSLAAAVQGAYAFGMNDGDYERLLVDASEATSKCFPGSGYDEMMDIARLRRFRDMNDARVIDLSNLMRSKWRGYGYFIACAMSAEYMVRIGDVEAAVSLMKESMNATKDVSLMVGGVQETGIDVMIEDLGVAPEDVARFRLWIREMASWDQVVR